MDWNFEMRLAELASDISAILKVICSSNVANFCDPEYPFLFFEDLLGHPGINSYPPVN